MGIETGALLSALGTAATTAAVGAVVSAALAPKPEKQSQPVTPISSADKPPQSTRAPDLSDIAKKNALAASASGALSGNSSTLLTGSQGISPSSLNLGQSKLLGQ